MQYDFIFVVLVYRNTKDLEDFFVHQNTPDSKVIVVNSFFDEVTESQFKAMAKDNKADFISVPNKGYGFGNNMGCKYALEHYSFKYLIISNADIEVRELKIKMLAGHEHDIVAPRLINKKGRNQNPANPYVSSKLYVLLMKYAFLNNKRKAFLCFSVISRFEKCIFQLIYSLTKYNRIFAPHGAFTIISFDALKRLYPIYNEEIFLFCEEPHLGNRARKNGVSIFYEPTIEIYHKEDGSMKIASIDTFEKTRDSFLKFYDFWYGSYKSSKSM